MKRVGDLWLVTVETGRPASSSATRDTEAREVAEPQEEVKEAGGGTTANVFVTLYWWTARGYASSGRVALSQPLNKQPEEAFQSGCLDRFRVRFSSSSCFTSKYSYFVFVARQCISERMQVNVHSNHMREGERDRFACHIHCIETHRIDSRLQVRMSGAVVGSVFKLRVEHDNAGERPAWFCEKVCSAYCYCSDRLTLRQGPRALLSFTAFHLLRYSLTRSLSPLRYASATVLLVHEVDSEACGCRRRARGSLRPLARTRPRRRQRRARALAPADRRTLERRRRTRATAACVSLRISVAVPHSLRFESSCSVLSCPVVRVYRVLLCKRAAAASSSTSNSLSGVELRLALDGELGDSGARCLSVRDELTASIAGVRGIRPIAACLSPSPRSHLCSARRPQVQVERVATCALEAIDLGALRVLRVRSDTLSAQQLVQLLDAILVLCEPTSDRSSNSATPKQHTLWHFPVNWYPTSHYPARLRADAPLHCISLTVGSVRVTKIHAFIFVAAKHPQKCPSTVNLSCRCATCRDPRRWPLAATNLQ